MLVLPNLQWLEVWLGRIHSDLFLRNACLDSSFWQSLPCKLLGLLTLMGLFLTLRSGRLCRALQFTVDYYAILMQ